MIPWLPSTVNVHVVNVSHNCDTDWTIYVQKCTKAICKEYYASGAALYMLGCSFGAFKAAIVSYELERLDVNVSGFFACNSVSPRLWRKVNCKIKTKVLHDGKELFMLSEETVIQRLKEARLWVTTSENVEVRCCKADIIQKWQESLRNRF